MGRPAMTQDEFIKRARIIHGDKYDYSGTVYTNMHGIRLIRIPYTEKDNIDSILNTILFTA
jgi:hypothetical protein